MRLTYLLEEEVGEVSKPSRSDVRVTLVCITYNHEEVLGQALESFVRQRTTFAYKVFVGDDGSTDRTREVLAEYAARYPDIIVPFYREVNLGAQRNLVDLCSHADSPYIAFCEGDDYLTDDLKLQKQFDYMEGHPEYRACFHATEILCGPDWYLNADYDRTEDGKIILPFSKKGYNGSLREMDASYYVSITPAHTSSMFFRWNYDLEIPDWYYTHFAGDHAMMMLQTGEGKIGFIPDVMSAYRRHDAGVYFYGDRDWHYYNVTLSWIQLLTDIMNYFDVTYGGYCKPQINRRITSASISYLHLLEKLDRMDDISRLCDDERDFETLKQIVQRVTTSARSGVMASKALAQSQRKAGAAQRAAAKASKSMAKLERRLGSSNLRFILSRRSSSTVSVRLSRDFISVLRRLASLRIKFGPRRTKAPEGRPGLR